MARALAVLLLVTILSAADVAFGQPPKVTIEYVTFQGSGCNWDNTNYDYSSDSTVVTFLFGGMTATTDSGVAGKRKNCVMSFKLSYPNGWSVSMAKVTGRGYAKLDDGVTGAYQASYHFSGQTGTARCKHEATGPMDSNFEYTSRFTDVVWSQCNSAPNFNLNVEVRVDGPPDAEGLVTVDTVDNKFKLLCYLEWNKC
eukprot:TRINITY_DN734_c0_g1_i1.p1 TRINITY_DN734_c0_g1~~TRINITY_DN734_c0_g1_i1.p1  ORF type:complete len:198 (-),score=28.98 TRINITY_DN734_c0_g1_i1:512-1105(-)